MNKLFDLPGAARVTAKRMAGWRHALGDTVFTTRLPFTAGSTEFDVATTFVAEDVAVFEAGMKFLLMPSAKLNVSYSGNTATMPTIRARTPASCYNFGYDASVLPRCEGERRPGLLGPDVGVSSRTDADELDLR